MSESATNKALRLYMPERCMQRIESRMTGTGIADIWAGDAAIESKCLSKYPAKLGTKVKLKHPLTIDQYRWLNERWNHGWKSYVVLQANRTDWYLFAPPDAYVLVTGYEVDRVRLAAQALWYSNKGIEHTTFSRSQHMYDLRAWLNRDVSSVYADRVEHGLVARWKDI